MNIINYNIILSLCLEKNSLCRSTRVVSDAETSSWHRLIISLPGQIKLRSLLYD